MEFAAKYLRMLRMLSVCFEPPTSPERPSTTLGAFRTAKHLPLLSFPLPKYVPFPCGSFRPKLPLELRRPQLPIVLFRSKPLRLNATKPLFRKRRMLLKFH